MRSFSRSASPWKWGAICVALAVAFSAATDIVTGNLTQTLIAAGLCASPLLIYVAFRWPLVFPFGLYAAAVPIDNILSISGGLTITKLVGIVATGGLVIRMLVIRRALAPGPAWTAWAIAIGWMALTTLWSVNQDESLRDVTVMLTLFGTYTATALYPAGRREVLVLCGINVIAGVGIALYALQQYSTGSMASDARLALGNDQYGIDPNHFAANFMLPIAIAVMGFVSIPNVAARVALAGATALMGLGLLLTGSRGGLISFGTLLLYVAIRTRRIRETIFIAVAGLAASLAFPTVFQRFTDPTQGAASGRFFIWEIAGPALATQMRWIYGSGFGSFPTVYDHEFLSVFQPQSAGYDRPGHNLIVQSSVEVGVIGLLLVLVAWYWTWRTPEAIGRGTPWFALRVASEGAVVALLVTAMSVDVLWFKYLWLAFVLGPLVRNAYAPKPLFGRRGASSLPLAGRATPRSRVRSSVSVASFEQTSVAPEM